MKLVVDYAYSTKYNVMVHRLIKAVKFRIMDTALENICYENRGKDKELLLSLELADSL